jgi:ppGpp synthetase/RelA/SpoT-type nucleotidyltranferase
VTESTSPETEAATEGVDIKGADDEIAFDFSGHRQQAVEAYQRLAPLYADFARAVYSILKTCLDNEQIKVHSVDHRPKTVESFGQKAAEPAEENPNRPKYERPLQQIDDLAGVRVITYFPNTEARVDPIITNEFEVMERT